MIITSYLDSVFYINHIVGALVSLKDEGNGKWLVKQLSTEVYEDEPLIDWRHGPVRVS